MTDERLHRILAYVDGELDPPARAAFEAEVAADPALAAEVARHRALAQRVSAAYAPVLEEPVPIRLAQAVRPRRRTPTPVWAALAASLAVGVLMGRFALAPPRPVEVGAEAPAGSALDRALDRALAADAGPIRIGLTFRDHSGAYCRTFSSAPDSLAGLACRHGDAWRVVMAAAWTAESAPDYRTAGAEISPEVLAAVDRTLGGETLGQAEERAARDAGWRAP